MVHIEALQYGFPLLAVLAVYFEKNIRRKFFYFAGISAAITASYGLKYIFMTSRPETAALLGVLTPSFPSTHAALGFFPLGFFLKEDNVKLKWGLLLFGLTVAGSRLWLGVHFPADVIVGGFLGLFIGFAAENLSQKSKKR